MKLRNKKTGEICNLLGMKISAGIIWINIEFHDREPKAYCYNSLAELNEEWEDYKPNEPLIKDEKIQEFLKMVEELKCSTKHLEERLKNLNETIAELCGEEEG